MTAIVFSHPEFAQLTFDVMLATPEMAAAGRFEAATISGSTDHTLSPAMYSSLSRGADVRAYAIRLGSTVVPLAVPVPREKLHPLYCRLLGLSADPATVVAWFGDEPKTVDEMMAIVGESL